MDFGRPPNRRGSGGIIRICIHGRFPISLPGGMANNVPAGAGGRRGPARRKGHRSAACGCVVDTRRLWRPCGEAGSHGFSRPRRKAEAVDGTKLLFPGPSLHPPPVPSSAVRVWFAGNFTHGTRLDSRCWAASDASFVRRHQIGRVLDKLSSRLSPRASVIQVKNKLSSRKVKKGDAGVRRAIPADPGALGRRGGRGGI